MTKAEFLVVDSGGFIKGAALRDIADNIVTLHEVVDEIRDKETRQRLQVLPYELQFRTPSSTGLKKVSEFARKTGDFASLSLTDLNVLAVTYDLEVELAGGSHHLRSEPVVQRTTTFYHPKKEAVAKADANIAGFYGGVEGVARSEEISEDGSAESDVTDENFDSVNYWREPVPDIELDLEMFGAGGLVEDYNSAEDFGYDSDQENDPSEESEEVEDEDEGWITPSNVGSKKKQFNGNIDMEETKKVQVACMTTDFAMQNVLKQLGLNILGTDGMVIKEAKTWILRCYGCFNTTPIMEKKFCPKCGNKTLKRVSVTINADGSQQVHISTRRQLTARGKKFSLPAPKGGKHGVNPRLVEDQREAHQRLSKKALMASNPPAEDFVEGNSPFYVKDVTSKSAMLGLHGHGKGNAEVPGQYWARKNPNSSRKCTGNRKKKA